MLARILEGETIPKDISGDWIGLGFLMLVFVGLNALAFATSAFKASRYKQLGRKFGATLDLSNARVQCLAGIYCGRHFRVRFVQGTGGKSGRNSETTVEMSFSANATQGSTALSQLLSLGDDEFMRDFSQMGPTMIESVPGKAERAVEELWPRAQSNSARYRRLFAKGRLAIGKDDIAWGCVGLVQTYPNLTALLEFLNRLGDEVVKGDANWTQSRKGHATAQIVDWAIWIVLALCTFVAIALLYLEKHH